MCSVYQNLSDPTISNTPLRTESLLSFVFMREIVKILQLLDKRQQVEREVYAFTGMSAIAFAEGMLSAGTSKEEDCEVVTLEFDPDSSDLM